MKIEQILKLFYLLVFNVTRHQRHIEVTTVFFIKTVIQVQTFFGDTMMEITNCYEIKYQLQIGVFVKIVILMSMHKTL